MNIMLIKQIVLIVLFFFSQSVAFASTVQYLRFEGFLFPEERILDEFGSSSIFRDDVLALNLGNGVDRAFIDVKYDTEAEPIEARILSGLELEDSDNGLRNFFDAEYLDGSLDAASAAFGGTGITVEGTVSSLSFFVNDVRIVLAATFIIDPVNFGDDSIDTWSLGREAILEFRSSELGAFRLSQRSLEPLPAFVPIPPAIIFFATSLLTLGLFRQTMHSNKSMSN